MTLIGPMVVAAVLALLTALLRAHARRGWSARLVADEHVPVPVGRQLPLAVVEVEESRCLSGRFLELVEHRAQRFGREALAVTPRCDHPRGLEREQRRRDVAHEARDADLARALRSATATTFDRVDSDGCMSTNDTVTVMASGASSITPTPEDFTSPVRPPRQWWAGLRFSPWSRSPPRAERPRAAAS